MVHFLQSKDFVNVDGSAFIMLILEHECISNEQTLFIRQQIRLASGKTPKFSPGCPWHLAMASMICRSLASASNGGGRFGALIDCSIASSSSLGSSSAISSSLDPSFDVFCLAWIRLRFWLYVDCCSYSVSIYSGLTFLVLQKTNFEHTVIYSSKMHIFQWSFERCLR